MNNNNNTRGTSSEEKEISVTFTVTFSVVVVLWHSVMWRFAFKPGFHLIARIAMIATIAAITDKKV